MDQPVSSTATSTAARHNGTAGSAIPTVAASSGLPAEHRANGRLVLQRGLFTGAAATINSDLYVITDGSPAVQQRLQLRLPAGASAHTNTYFGRFAASYWQRWTTLTDLEVSARLDPVARARVRLVASDIAGHRRVVDAMPVDTAGVVTLRATLDRFVDGGALWLEFDAYGGELGVADVAWTAVAPPQLRSVAIAICTFNRADDCAATVAALASDDMVISRIDAMYVVDQGTDPVSDRTLFSDTAVRLGDKLRYLRQNNLGGAGGFTRGLYEATAADAHADVILMDDDILCEPETVLRLHAFANMTVEPTLVGAQMMYLLNPDYLNVGAEEAHLHRLMHGQPVPEALCNTSMVTHNQERRVDAGYNAWWTCLIPAEVVAKIGLPLPVFFQWDDVEYGIRARAAGYVTVTLPNAAVWHADFYWKEYDDWSRYFSTRNSLIVGCLHADLDPKAVSRQLFRHIAESLVAMNYGLVNTVLQGIEDFLRGPQILADGGAEAVARAHTARNDYPETVKHPAAWAPIRSAELHIRRAGGEPNRPLLVLCKRALSQWLGFTRHGLIGVTREDAYWWHISLFDYVVVTDSSQSGVRIRQRDKAKAVALLKRAWTILRKLRRRLPRLQQEYRAAVPGLISRENWARLYGL